MGLLHLVSLTPVPPSGEGRVTADGWAGSQQLFQNGQKTHKMNPCSVKEPSRLPLNATPPEARIETNDLQHGVAVEIALEI